VTWILKTTNKGTNLDGSGVTQGPDAEIVIDFPEALEHKYFDVEHRAV